MPEEEEEKR